MSKRPGGAREPKRPGGPLTDRAVLAEAGADGRAILSKEGDFGRLIYLEGANAPAGIIITRYGFGVSPEDQATLLARLAADDSPIKLEGMYTIIEKDFIRQRPLPPRIQHAPVREQRWHRHRN